MRPPFDLLIELVNINRSLEEQGDIFFLTESNGKNIKIIGENEEIICEDEKDFVDVLRSDELNELEVRFIDAAWDRYAEMAHELYSQLPLKWKLDIYQACSRTFMERSNEELEELDDVPANEDSVTYVSNLSFEDLDEKEFWKDRDNLSTFVFGIEICLDKLFNVDSMAGWTFEQISATKEPNEDNDENE